MRKMFLMLLLTSTLSGMAETIDSLKSVELQGVQVSSTRASKKTPMAFSDMNKEQISQVNHGQDIPYLLSLTPSVTVTSDAGNGIGYTTLRVRGTAPERINITANGVPLNDAESAQVYWVNMGDFASSVQSMQIQRGVGTSTNGAGAFGATLNMQTDNISIQPYVGIDLSGGSFYTNKQTVRFSSGLPDEGHWGLQGRVSHIGSKGYIDRAKTQLASYFLQYGYFGENTVVKLLTWNGEEQTYHAWDYTSKYEQQVYGRTFNPCGAMTWDNDVFYDNQTDNYHQQNYQLLFTHRFSNLLNLNAALHYTRGDGYYEQYKIGAKLKSYFPLTAAENGMKSDLVRQKKMGNDFYGAIASLNYDNRKGLEATVGGGWNKYDGDHFGRVKWVDKKPSAWQEGYEYYRDNAKKTDMNVYGKLNYTLWRGLSAFLDMQYRRITYKMQDPADWYVENADGRYVIDEKFGFFNPKAGLNWQVDSRHRLYASYGVAHKEPTRNDYEANLGLNLKAERLLDLEAGYQFASERFSAGANFYWMNYKDQFVLTGELNDIGEAVAMNVPKSYRLGIELEAAWRPVDWFRWDANATISRNRVKDAVVTLHDYNPATGDFDVAGTANVGDTPLSFSPGLVANNIFTFGWQGLSLSLQSQYVGEQYLTNSGFKTMTGWDENGKETCESITLADHFTTNADLSYRFAWRKTGLKDATVGITLYNVLNKKYDTNGWAAPKYHLADGQVRAFNSSHDTDGAIRDQWGVGFAPAAPFNFMAHLSLNF